MVSARPASVQDVVSMLPRLRASDREEIRAVYGVDPEAVLLPAPLTPDTWSIVTDEGEVLGMFGLDSFASDPMVGQVWMVATDGLPQHQIAFLRGSRRWIEKLHDSYPVLGNFVDARNTLHIKWLRWMGFHFINRFEEWGAQRRPFLQFVRIQNPDV